MTTSSRLLDTTTKKSIAAILVTALSSGGVFTLLDSRYALAAEVQEIHTSIDNLAASIYEDRIERLEILIAETERRISFLSLIPEDERSSAQKQMLLSESGDKDRHLRKLKRLTNL